MVKIRRAEPSDGAAIAKILGETGWFSGIDSEPSDRIINRIDGLMPEVDDVARSVYVAVTGENELVGYTAVHWLPYLFLPGPEGFVSELFVDPTERGQGVGRRLLAAVQVEAKERGCS